MIFKKKQEDKQKERREFKRIDFIQSSYFKTTGKSEINECWFNNISAGGISIDIDFDLPAGNEILVIYKIGSKIMKDPVMIKHKSRILNNWRCGCSFLNKDEERMYIIDNLAGL
jgi:hypothetical protein